ncbi:MAG: YncE family protein [Candidatus Dormibacteria bacterium]
MQVGSRTRGTVFRRRRTLRTAVTALAGAATLAVSACGGSTATPRGSPTATGTPQTSATATGTPTATVAPASRTAEPTPTPAASDLMAYVAVSDGEVIPVDVTAGTAATPILVDPSPAAIAITPDGGTAYVADADTATLTPVDLATGAVGTAIQVASDSSLSAVAISPDGATAYLTVDPSVGVTGSVVPITLAGGEVGTPIPVGADPVAIAITPDGATAYVVNGGDGTVTPIDLASGTADDPIWVGIAPVSIAMAPDGATAYVLGGAGLGAVTPITLSANPTQDVAGNPIDVQSGAPTAIAITPDGASAWVLGGSGADQIALPAGTEKGTALTGDYTAVAISPDGTTALLGYTRGSEGVQGLVPVGVSSDTAGTPLPLAGEPVSIAFAPSGSS